MKVGKVGRLVHGLMKSSKDADEVVDCLGKLGVDGLCECMYNICNSPHFTISRINKKKLRQLLQAHEKKIKKICNKALPHTLRQKLLKSIPDLCEIFKLAWPALKCLTHYERNSVST